MADKSIKLTPHPDLPMGVELVNMPYFSDRAYAFYRRLAAADPEWFQADKFRLRISPPERSPLAITPDDINGEARMPKWLYSKAVEAAVELWLNAYRWHWIRTKSQGKIVYGIENELGVPIGVGDNLVLAWLNARGK